MVLQDLSEVQSGDAFHIECHVSRDEMCLFCDTVDNYHDHIIAIGMRKLDNEINTDDIPSVCRSLCRAKLSIGLVMLPVQLHRSQVLM
jgi:hypothetical protein